MTDLPRGVLAAVPTFFHDDESLDLDALVAHLQRMAGNGVRGVLVCGSTGEFPVLDLDERMAVAECAVSSAAAALTVVVHVGSASTRDSVCLAEHSARIGAHAVAAITPYYLPVSAAAMAVHLRRVKQACGELPLLAYSFPARAGTQYPLDVLELLAGEGVIAGVKESGPDLQRLLDIRGRCGAGFRVYAGAAELLAAAVSRGMDGGVLALANAVPRELVAVYECAARGAVVEAEARLARLSAVQQATQVGLAPAGLKAVLATLFGAPQAVRAPRLTLDGAEKARIAALLDAEPTDLH